MAFSDMLWGAGKGLLNEVGLRDATPTGRSVRDAPLIEDRPPLRLIITPTLNVTHFHFPVGSSFSRVL